MRLLIFGSREWTSRKLIHTWIKRESPDVLIHGACRGADLIAGDVALLLEIEEIVAFPARWRKFRRGAGPIRNQLMIDRGRPDRAIGFHEDFVQSSGTRDMADRLAKAKIPHLVLDADGEPVVTYRW